MRENKRGNRPLREPIQSIVAAFKAPSISLEQRRAPVLATVAEFLQIHKIE
jgi:hypothetical protein